MKPYPKYKDSTNEWIGQIPDSWRSMPVKYLVRLSSGAGFPDDEQGNSGESLPFFKVADMNLSGNEVHLNNFSNTISQETARRLRAEVFESGTILFPKVGAALLTNKRRIVTKPCCCDNNVMAMLPQKINGEYLYYFMCCWDLTPLANPGTVPSINASQVASERICVPSVQEQNTITNYCQEKTRQIDDLIEKKKKQIELLKEYRASVISEAVTKGLNPNVRMKDSGVEWIGEIPQHWEVVGLTKYLQSIVDYRGKTPEKTDDGIFLVTAKNIRSGRIDYEISKEYVSENSFRDILKRGKPRVGDVLFTTEAPLGEVAVVDREDIALAQRVIKFRPIHEQLDSDFLKYWILSGPFQQDLARYATGSTALGIKSSKLNKLILVLPPIDEQQDLVAHLMERLASIEALISMQRSQINHLQSFRTSLISEAVTGKIDVRDWAKV
jgi:type I restriction enzyme S subunit